MCGEVSESESESKRDRGERERRSQEERQHRPVMEGPGVVLMSLRLPLHERVEEKREEVQVMRPRENGRHIDQ